jgi:pimeloyl-ACP methyl ester carboxylesterase
MNLPSKLWSWRGYNIAYQSQGDRGPAVVLIHGFGANWRHWRKNIPSISEHYRCYALDLIGFGESAKPSPQEVSYTMETWGDQVADFCREIVQGPAYLIGNSIGCVVALQSVVDHSELYEGLMLINCSLRLLHDRRRQSLPWYKQVSSTLLQRVLENKAIGHFFFDRIAKPQVIKNILSQAYCDHTAITPELIEILYRPSQDEGAADVFLAFTAYSQGPLPEDLLPQLQIPCRILWGEQDPWEPIALGRAYGEYATVDQFISLPQVGHCPQDEAPDVVNPLILEWLGSQSVTPSPAA